VDPIERIPLARAAGELTRYDVETTYYRLWRLAADGLIRVERDRNKLYMLRGHLPHVAELIRARQPAARRVLGLAAPAVSPTA
jgi:hypothetical protein